LWAAAIDAIARYQAPETADHERLAVGPQQLAEESTGERVKCMNQTIPEVADQEITGKRAERSRSYCEAPRRVQGALNDEVLLKPEFQLRFSFREGNG
jgi:hypothetical protein